MKSYSGGNLTDLVGNSLTISNNIRLTGNGVTVGEDDQWGVDENGNYTGNKIMVQNYNGSTTLNYLLYIPHVDKVGSYQNIPLIIWLHGKAEARVYTPANGTKQGPFDVNRVKRAGLMKYINTDATYEPRAIVVAPQSRNGDVVVKSDDLDKFVNHVRETLKRRNIIINENKISIVGHSMGASAATRAAAYGQTRYSCCVALSYFDGKTIGKIDTNRCKVLCIQGGKENGVSNVSNALYTKGKDHGKNADAAFTWRMNQFTTDRAGKNSGFPGDERLLIEWMIAQTRNN